MDLTLNHDQTAALIATGGSFQTVIVEGETGVGKSALLNSVAKLLPTHKPVYFDATTKDLGDIQVPWITTDAAGRPTVSTVPNTELGFTHDGPVLVLIDEIGKPGGSRTVQNGLLQYLYERKLGDQKLHPDSIVFAATNLRAEGLGDMIQNHARNRMTTVRLRKPTANEWLMWGIENKVNPTMLAFVKDRPAVLQPFDEVDNPDDNQYIVHPKSTRIAGCTPRSLAFAAKWLDKRKVIGDDQALTAVLAGCIGEKAAGDLVAYIAMADKLPKRADILRDPVGTIVPDSGPAQVMIACNFLSHIAPEEVAPFLTYLGRMTPEIGGVVANSVARAEYPHKTTFMMNRAWADWSVENRYLFGADV